MQLLVSPSLAVPTPSGAILDYGIVGPDMDVESVDGDIESIGLGGRFEECSIDPRKRTRQLIAFTPDSELSPPGTIYFSSLSLSDPRADDETEIIRSPPRARPRRSMGGQRALYF